MLKLVFILIFTPIISCMNMSSSEPLQMAIEKALSEEEAMGPRGVTALSRHRRYLIFPEGSSLQVVFCLTYGSNIEISDIFYLGATASLAWELPQDPYSPYDHHAEALHRVDNKYYDMNTWKENINKYTGKLEKKSWTEKKNAKKPRKRILSNPAFAKRSIPDSEELDRIAMHEEQYSRPHLDPEFMSENIIENHRRTRRALYQKIEKLLIGLGSDGRQCVLKTLCEMGQDQAQGQGTFLEEIMRAVFTLPKGRAFEDFRHQAYDDAHRTSENCSKLFPYCPDSLKNMPLSS